nr:TlpA disulfide reductase family protein [uncultured Flavobacterium sp.]
MKKNITLALLASSLILASCKKNEGHTLEKLDNEIATGFENIKDSTKSHRDTIVVNDEFKKVTLNKEFTTLDGNKISFKNILNENKGKTIVIDIWASWCPDCIKGFPSLEEVQKKYPDAAYVFLSLDKTEEAWKQAIEKYNLKGSHYYLNEKMSGEFGKSIDLDWIPRYIIVNKQGKIADYKSIVADDKTFLFTLKNSEKKDQ